jgi:hypothetical protein
MPRMASRDTLIKVAVAVHLGIAAVYALPVPMERYIPAAIERPLAIYGGFTGAHTRHDYFAPGVSTEARADFLLVGANGESRRVRLATPSAEANRRLRLMFTLYTWPSERERLTRAWGEYMLRLDPEAVAVETRVEVLQMPSLEEAAAGKRATWAEVARTVLRRGEATGS